MDYTHTFEIKINNMQEISGQLYLCNTGKPCIKIEDQLSMEIDDFSSINALLKTILEVYTRCGSIDKIEINKII